LTSLLKTIGENLDNEEKMRPSMDVYFTRIESMIDAKGLPSRLKFMLMVSLSEDLAMHRPCWLFRILSIFVRRAGKRKTIKWKGP
jgi:hypothetical protein